MLKGAIVKAARFFRKEYLVVVLGFAFAPSTALPQNPSISPTPTACDGFVAHAKSEGVPIYRSPDATADVVRKLKSEEEVCCIGRQAEFVILHLESTPIGADERGAKSGTNGDEDSEPSTLGFIKETDLWLPQRPSVAEAQGSISTFEKLKRYIRYVQSGGVPEDGLLPYRWLIGHSEPELKIPTVSPTPASPAK